ncbi:sugar phosphate isomerase/epimerase [Sutcliffiella horikoshii]|uniref:sugar phosphate isomerase/epimerase family protein n=1 Tax=Sutcliffiella horikoshii TaxID=79883 RepID=UPI001CBC58AE|nr:sugar phosphate isomerase/epimerase family protein [Sutcliffiella horikoshii]UAL48019.1 sugar phosphate isomerase/epimerase [Sutcliffiella horikoshii]
MSTKWLPSLLIPEIYFPVKDQEGMSSYLIEQHATEGFYKSFEISDIKSEQERKQIGCLVERYNIEVTQWLPSLIKRNKLDLSSLNPQVRGESIRQIKENLYFASECGAGSVALISGGDPGPEQKTTAFASMFDSLSEICEEAAKYPINVLIEPIGYKASLNGLLGPINLVSHMIDRLKENYENIGLVFDTAHIALNEEDIFNALQLTKSHITGIHLSNAVLDKDSLIYGDNHIPVGEPGFLTMDLMNQFLRKAGRILNREVKVAIEVRNGNFDECRTMENKIRKIQKSLLSNL